LSLGRRKHRDHQKHSITKTNEKEDNDIDDDIKTEENEAENEIRRVKLVHPVRIREGHGISIRRKYKIDPKHIHLNNRQQRQCWSWYRQQTQKIRRNPSKYLTKCIDLHNRNEKCINQLIHNTFNNTEQEHGRQQQSPKNSLIIGSKLYCANNAGYNKLLGLYDHGEICFSPSNQVYIEYKFTDIAGLSDIHKNQDTIDFIGTKSKLTAEFEDDCHEKTNLVETSEPEGKS